MSPREYAMKWWFVIPPLLTNVSAVPGETWRWTPRNCVFSVMLYTVSWKRHCFGLLYLRRASTNFNIFFVDNKVSTVCKYYFSLSNFVFETRYAAWHIYFNGSMTEKTISGLHVYSGSAQTLVRRGGLTNHCLIACSLSNISTKNN